MVMRKRFDPLELQVRRHEEKKAGRFRILYVEDDENNWKVANLNLRDRFELQWAKNSREACEKIKVYAGSLFAVLMDIELQGSELDGIGLTRLLRGTLPLEDRPPYAADIPPLEVPIVFVTAYETKYSEADLLAEGGNWRIVKPVDFAELSTALVAMDMKQLATLAIEIVRATSKPNADVAKLLERAEADVVFSTRMKSFIDHDILDAPAAETLDGLRNIAISIVLSNLMPQGAPGAKLASLCLRRTAACISLVKRLCKARTSDGLSMGLLLDGGLVISARHDLQGALQIANSPACDRILRARAFEEVEHPTRSAYLAMDWKLSKDIVEAIRHHHAPAPADDLMAQIAWTAERMAGVFEGGHAERNYRDAIAALQRLGMSEDEANRVLDGMPSSVALLAEAFGMGPGSQIEPLPAPEELREPRRMIEALDSSYQDGVRTLEALSLSKSKLVKGLSSTNRTLTATREKQDALASAAHRRFLPSQASAKSASLSLQGFHRTAHQCGGDWWWYDPQHKRDFVLVGDVTGHGVDAAIITASVATSFRTLLRQAPDLPLSTLLQEAHEALWDLAQGDYAMALCAVEFEAASELLHIFSAGGQPVLITPAKPTATTGGFERIVAGTALGSETFQPGHETVPLLAKDRVLLCTDGLTSIRSKSGRKLSWRWLQSQFNATAQMNLRAVTDRLVGAIETAQGASPQPDDITFVVLEREI